MKKKIRLNAEELEVLSFATVPNAEMRGTVLGAGSTVSVDERTHCLAYTPSIWDDETCAACVPIRVTDVADPTCVTCMTCPGINLGC